MKKILLVDDETEELRILSIVLDCKEIRAEILTASSGEEALDLIKKEEINLLITDVHMPGMNGMELIMAASAEVPDLAFIVLTAYATAEIERDALLKGCLRFVEKPYDIEELREIVIEGLALKKGFTGTMVGINLADLIQLNCLSSNTGALKVSDRKKSGVIFFDRGDIVHAMVGDVEGEEAFYQILALRDGNIESRKNVKAPTRSIDKSHVALLLEGSRRSDENENHEQNETEEPEAPQIALFRKLAKISGYIGAAILKKKGEIVALDIIEDKLNLSSGGPILAELFKKAVKATVQSGLEKCVSTIIDAADGTIAMCSVGRKKELILVILIAPGNNQALLQMKMAHFTQEVSI
ncbi:MAG: response regulator [Proteobacteria bacterium]|nr:response regulator [Pseudomonadota bacterium]MBU1715269.1 response regulator [Pseudomonadota bacterium]